MPTREWQQMEDGDRKIVESHIIKPLVPLGALAKDLGINVQLSALPANRSGLIRKRGDGYEIKINRFESRSRQRFTLAHEISHYLLHRDTIDRKGEAGLQDSVLYRSGEPERIEFEANRLAAEIVMPRALLDAKIKTFAGNLSEEAVESLAEQFGVSKAAMEVRVGIY